MTLFKSISGIRGTIGGGAGEGLNPLDIVKFTSAYATLIRKTEMYVLQKDSHRSMQKTAAMNFISIRMWMENQRSRRMVP